MGGDAATTQMEIDHNQTVNLWTYHCIDGIVRTRCAYHVRRAGPYAIRGEMAVIRRQLDQPLYRW